MDPFIQAIMSTGAVSAFIAVLFFIFYLVAVKGSESPLLLYDRFKNGFEEHSRKKRAKGKMTEYRTFFVKPSFLRSSILFSIFLFVIFLLLFKLVFFTAITSESMQPTFKRGDLVLMQKLSPVPEEGDIIMFNRPEYLLPITHRVIAIAESGVRTQGDARGRADPWIIPEEEILGKAVRLGENPLVLQDVGDYFIINTREMHFGRYGSEYTFIKNAFLTIRLYGYALCVISILGYVILTLQEAKKR
jgi:signal peptidase